MRSHALRAALGATLVLLAGGALWIRLAPAPFSPGYAGSARCESCHPDEHDDWAASQHQRIMRPAHQRGVVVADFHEAGTVPRFDLGQVVWAIGGKWEQQFMGFDGKTETLLPGAWLEMTGHWDLNGWDGWEIPVPRQRCHGCHTVGLDRVSGHFVEPNIGCESCHGPGRLHADTFGLGPIYLSVGAEVCGQCHTRGRSPSGEFFFPVDYRPGGDLEADFRFEKPSAGQTSSYWWGNGHERERHQEYWAWKQGGHSHSLRDLREGYDGRYGAVTQACLRCHAGDYVLAEGPKPGVDEVRQGITCSVCHNVHGDLQEVRMGCRTCHVSGASYHHPERNASHVPCPAEARVDCVDCHMPRTATTGGAFVLHSHRAGIVPPSDTLRYGTPSSCANGGCHADVPAERLQALFEAHYGAGAGASGAARGTARAPSIVPHPAKLP